MLPHISANEELQMPGLWRKEPWAELSYETVDAYRVGPQALSRCTAGSCSPPARQTTIRVLLAAEHCTQVDQQPRCQRAGR
jgi:hypothetical protein